MDIERSCYEMSKKNKPILTKHSKKRAKERAGITKNQLDTMAQRALKEGITHAQAKNELQSWMDGEYLKYETANNCRFYANKLYVFHDYTLITILDAPLTYEQNLQLYVDCKTYIIYKKNRIAKKKKDYCQKCNQLFEGISDIIQKDIDAYLKSSPLNQMVTDKYTYGFISSLSFQVVIHVKGSKTDREKLYIPNLKSYIKNKFGLDTSFKKMPDLLPYLSQNGEVCYDERREI